MDTTDPSVRTPANLPAIPLDNARLHERHRNSASDTPGVYARSLFQSISELWLDAPYNCIRDPIAVSKNKFSELESASQEASF